MDIPSVASCVPGVENLNAEADGAYTGSMKVKVGPILLNLTGKIHIVSRDDAAHLSKMRAEASDKKIGGSVRAILDIDAHEIGPDRTVVHMRTDAVIMGKIGEFGQPLIKKKADAILGDFAEEVGHRLSAVA